MKVRALLAAALVLGSCGALPSASPAPSGPPLAFAELKERVMAAAGRIWFCDPDYYPIARADERDIAQQRIADIQKDTETYAVITAHVGTDVLTVYREWKALNALQLGPVNDVYGFAYLAQRTASTGERVDGRVTKSGQVTVVTRTPSGPPNCPICLARGTRIATPSGEAAVEDLRAGDVVWTRDLHGARVAAPLVAIGSTPVPPTHEVVRVALEDGRIVLASPRHPTADGRLVGDLLRGDALDGSLVASVQREPYAGAATFDVLPAGATGVYWANGIALGSTLRRRD